jgi:hypothetical protein
MLLQGERKILSNIFTLDQSEGSSIVGAKMVLEMREKRIPWCNTLDHQCEQRKVQHLE